jgi:hypothetical protein
MCKKTTDWEDQGQIGSCTFICGEFKQFLHLPAIFRNK